MDYFLVIWAVVAFVESRLAAGFSYEELERTTGFLLAHIRDVFARQTGKPLSSYILERRIANAAFEMIYGRDSMLDIAARCGFTNPDTFTRAFKRITSMTPREFRKKRCPAGRVKLCAGVYGAGIPGRDAGKDENMSKEQSMNTEGSVILYGVPKVEYGPSGCTPYPMCVRACANYLGQDISYDYAMASSGAAFRLTWDTTCWNGGNVDSVFAFDDPTKVYRMGIEALGRRFEFLGRKSPAAHLSKSDAIEQNTGKDAFIDFIKKQIDAGYPCIAIGIIGPPEACIVTGYRENGQVLLGWNFFQHSPEFASGVSFDDSGYFITRRWWENECTVAVMSMGEVKEDLMSAKTVVAHALEVMRGRQYEDYAKGLSAHDAWKGAVADDAQFPDGAILPILAERLMCQGDAMDCLADGRYHAAAYMGKLAEQYPQHGDLCRQAQNQFKRVFACAMEMYKTLGGFARNERQMRTLARPEVRKEICALIDKAKAADKQACKTLEELAQLL